tara:strand:- start:319 stop:486 length:168 start_codon:yes stop_codon:yes gene_type:complete
MIIGVAANEDQGNDESTCHGMDAGVQLMRLFHSFSIDMVQKYRKPRIFDSKNKKQ